LIRTTSRVDLAKSVCPYERNDLGNYKSYKYWQIIEVSAQCHAHSYAYKPPKTVAPTA